MSVQAAVRFGWSRWNGFGGFGMMTRQGRDAADEGLDTVGDRDATGSSGGIAVTTGGDTGVIGNIGGGYVAGGGGTVSGPASSAPPAPPKLIGHIWEPSTPVGPSALPPGPQPRVIGPFYKKPGSGLSTGAIVGIAAGGVGVLGLILILALKRRR